MSITSYGRKVVLLLSKLDTRIFRPALAALDSTLPLPVPLAAALQKVDEVIDDLVKNARISNVTV